MVVKTKIRKTRKKMKKRKVKAKTKKRKTTKKDKREKRMKRMMMKTRHCYPTYVGIQLWRKIVLIRNQYILHTYVRT